MARYMNVRSLQVEDNFSNLIYSKSEFIFEDITSILNFFAAVGWLV